MTLRPQHYLAALVSLCTFVAGAHAQSTFPGHLDPGLHVDASTSSPAILDPVSLEDAQKLGAAAAPGDKLFAGDLALPKGGNLRYRVVVIRHPDGTDLLYLDRNRNGHFEPAERTSFGAIESPDQPKDQQTADKQPKGPPLKGMASVKVDLPGPLFSTCPMQVWLIRDGVRTPARPEQLAVIYASLPFVQGTVPLPHRTLQLRFEYDPDKQDVLLNDAREWIDLNGDGQFDMTPGSGEFLRARGAPPIFDADGLTLQMKSIHLASGQFVLQSVPASADRRIPLTVGAHLPDFAFTDFSGARHHLSELKGRYVLLDFWATWCAPCMADLPRLQQAYTTFHPQGLELLSIDGDESPEKPQTVILQKGLTWPQARYDADLLENRFQISLWPTLILIDLSGGQRTIVSIGQPDHLPLDGDHLAATLTTLLAQKPSGQIGSGQGSSLRRATPIH